VRRRSTLMVAVALAAGGALSACGGQATDEPTRVAERFYEAVERGDGASACAELSPDAVSELESQGESPCRRAVLELKLAGARARRSEAYLTTARVEMDRGDHVYLDETAAGWRVAAAGCRPEPGDETPDDCELEA
jgi:ketosteroid isomerase-like protein